MFDDFDRFMNVPDEWAPPPNKEYTPGVMIIEIHSTFIITLYHCQFS
jgi:hypothetical protein